MGTAKNMKVYISKETKCYYWLEGKVLRYSPMVDVAGGNVIDTEAIMAGEIDYWNIRPEDVAHCKMIERELIKK